MAGPLIYLPFSVLFFYLFIYLPYFLGDFFIYLPTCVFSSFLKKISKSSFIFKNIFIYLAAPGLSRNTWDLRSSLLHV